MLRNKKRKIYFSLLIAIVVLVSLILRIRQSNDSDEVVKELSPTLGRIRTFISTTGTVQPQNRLEIKPPISGRIEKILVKEGEKVIN